VVIVYFEDITLGLNLGVPSNTLDDSRRAIVRVPRINAIKRELFEQLPDFGILFVPAPPRQFQIFAHGLNSG
jgi:hypothetical protein